MITLKEYPYWSAATLPDVIKQVGLITNIRKDDITQIGTLPNIFMSGRKVGKIPASSTDVAATDRVGDQNYNGSYLYILVDNAGTPAWRRFTGGVW